MMRAVVIRSQGDLGVMEYTEVEMPPLRSRQVRVAMRACSLNYHDIFTRRGMPGVRTPLPMVLGCDCAGVIAEMAPDVQGGPFALGDRVLCDPLARFKRKEDPAPELKVKFIGDTRWGGYAEYVVVWDRQLIKLPDSIPFEVAACLPVAYGSAHRMVVHHAQVKKGEKVLVLGASGGVGNCAVQLAKAEGCTVVGACGSAARCRQLTELFGVDATVDTSTDDLVAFTRKFTGGRLLSGGGFDVVVNSQGGDFWVAGLKCLRQGGRMVTNGALTGFDPKTDIRYIFEGELRIQGSNGWGHRDLVRLVALVEAGRLRPHIGATLPLRRGIEAHAALEKRTYFGKIVLVGYAPVLAAGAPVQPASRGSRARL